MSIPKIIHYVWFSENIPADVSMRLGVWKRLMPEYELKCWNSATFDVASSKWVASALKHKKWAFATDYVRLWALHEYGGIYLDADVQVLRPFDDLLELPYFIGREKTKGIFEGAVIGASPKCNWIREVLETYEGREFDIASPKSETPLPKVLLSTLRSRFGIKLIDSHKAFDFDDPSVQVLPADYFSPKRWDANYARVTENTFCIHLFHGAWVSPKGIVAKAKSAISKGVSNFASFILGEQLWLSILGKLYVRGRG